MHGRNALRDNLATHLTAAVVVPGCLALGWWQLSRALAGNTLSWAYVFEWPIFAAYAVFMWWKLTHDRPGEAAPATPEDGATPVGTRAREADPTTRSTDGPDDTAHGPDDTATGPDDTAHGPDDIDAAGEDEELASYNRYLAALNASDKRKRW